MARTLLFGVNAGTTKGLECVRRSRLLDPLPVPYRGSDRTLLDAHERTIRLILAFLILAHHKPDQLVRLIDRLPSDSPIFIHFDRRARREDWDRLSALLRDRANVSFVRRHRCRWGGYGIVAGTIELMRALVHSGRPFDYAALLSGSDYPIRSARDMAELLAATPDREHMEAFPLDRPNGWSNDIGPYAGPRRYSYCYLKFRSRFIAIFKRRGGPLGMRLFGGSQWWCLTRECIHYMDDFIRKTPRFRSFFRHSLIPDEAFFQTILSNSPFAEAISGNDLTYVHWVCKMPAVLDCSDIPTMLASRKLFARKFDMDRRSAVLDEIDNIAKKVERTKPREWEQNPNLKTNKK